MGPTSGLSRAMPRRLTLLRHAQAYPARAGQHDFERPLDPVGLQQLRLRAPAFAAATREHPVDRCVFSPATRTAATAAAFVAALALPPGTSTPEAALYEIELQELLAYLCNTPDEIRHLLVVGHNPGLSLLAARLAAAGSRGGLAPCNHATVVFDGDWSDLP